MPLGTRRVRLRSLRSALSSTWRTRSRDTSIRRPISARVRQVELKALRKLRNLTRRLPSGI